jgi:hypothetical protein
MRTSRAVCAGRPVATSLEVEVNHFVKRMTGSALVMALATLLFATPCAADAGSPAAPRSLTSLSPASLRLLNAAPAATPKQEGSTASPGGFFKSRRGAVALGLVAAGVGFTVWTIHDSRKPVKSPVR